MYQFEPWLVLAGAIVAVTALVAYLTRRNRPDTPDAIGHGHTRNSGARNVRNGSTANLRTYSVFTLGTSGAGKTCFLASMHQQLGLLRPDVGFFLETAGDQAVRLRKAYNLITDPYDKWPGGTVGDDTWHFTTNVASANGTNYFAVFRFAYLDYAGGHLKDAAQAVALNAQQRVDDADAVLVLIDGQKILHRLRKTEGKFIPDPNERLGGDLAFLLPYLNRAARKPVHLVVSKYDLLAPQYGLEDVRECLLGYPGVKNLVAQRSSWGTPTRLIPVSAVGFDFARMEEDGSMSKNPEAHAEPYQVEISMAATLTDVFEAVLNGLNEQQVTGVLQAATDSQRLPSEHWQWLTRVLDMTQALPFPYSAVSILAPVLNQIVTVHRKDTTAIQRTQESDLGQVKDIESALRSAITSHNVLMRRFEDQHPESILVASRWSAAVAPRVAS